MTLPIPAWGEIIIVSFEYAPNGLDWVRLWDNHCLGWLVSEAGLPVPTERKPETPPPETTGEHAPFPLILGSLAAPAPDTTPVLSPQWAKYDNPVMFIPDLARMMLPDFLTWLATNNGAHRLLGSMLGLSRPLLNGFNQWALDNPDIAFTGEPPGS